jgi:hypothetical protein
MDNIDSLDGIKSMSPESENELWECRCRCNDNIRNITNIIHEITASRFLPTFVLTPHIVQFHSHVLL